MQTKLTILENLINTEIGAACSYNTITIDCFQSWQSIIYTQQHEIEKDLLEKSFKTKRKHFQHYVHRFQKCLVILSDQLFSLQLTNPAYVSEFQDIYKPFDSLLNFIFIHFPDELNPQQTLPIKSQTDASVVFKPQLLTIKQNIQVVDNQLKCAVFSALESIDYNALTYSDLSYLEILLGSLLNLCQSSKLQLVDNQLIGALFYLNFNSWKFFNFLIENVRSLLENQVDITSKINILALQLKQTKQYKVRKDIVFNPKQKSICKLFCQWLCEEITYLETLHHFPVQTDSTALNPSNFKVQTDLSVPQAAYILRLFHDIRIVLNPNVTQLTEFVATSISTRKTDKVSAESFRIKFNVIEESTRESVKGILIRMLNEINKYKSVIVGYLCIKSIDTLFFQQILDTFSA